MTIPIRVGQGGMGASGQDRINLPFPAGSLSAGIPGTGRLPLWDAENPHKADIDRSFRKPQARHELLPPVHPEEPF